MSAGAVPVERQASSARVYSDEQLCGFMREEAWCIGTYADVLSRMLDMHDRAATAYFVRVLVARVKALRDAHALLIALDREDHPHAG